MIATCQYPVRENGRLCQTIAYQVTIDGDSATLCPHHIGVVRAAHADVQAQVREFAGQFPTPNVRRAVGLAESGQLRWADVYAVCRDAIVTARQQVSAETVSVTR